MNENSSIVRLRQPGDIDDPLTNILRSGARKLLAEAIEQEAEAFLAGMKELKLADGRDRVVRHGHGPTRTIQTGIGATREGLSRGVGEAHRRYTAFVNARARETGHLFQGRFGCVAMDEAHMLNALRYLAFNPVRAGLCKTPSEWEWSSVRAHARGRSDALVDVRPVLAIAPRFDELLQMSLTEQAELAGFETSSSNGRPLGDAAFVALLEQKLGRSLRKGRPGPKPKAAFA